MSYIQRHIETKKHIKINLSADVWELFTNDHPVESENAAREINAAIEESFNRGNDKKTVERAALVAMRANLELGAMDTEPRAVLDDLLSELFKD